MPERDHFTNGRTWTFGTGFGLMSLSFGAQISGWGHWITVGAGYGVGIVLMLIAAVLITKSYFSRHPESHDGTLPTLALPPVPSKLVIHSANYGIEGKDSDVTATIRSHANSALVVRVGADLFHGFDPLVGVLKRLKVRYSFEGHEATVERPETELLVIPEDPYLKQAATREHERRLESANNVDGLFTALQIEAFRLARELDVLMKRIPVPKAETYQKDFPTQTEWHEAFTKAWTPHEEALPKVRAEYSHVLAPKVKDVVLRLRKEGCKEDTWIDQWFEQIPNELYLRTLRDKIVAMAHDLDGVHLSVVSNV
ncbi:MAG: hypothetical protein JWQ49_1776 [Edaphobacter sp.]|nr:hypothetical protein [Edaphobacter sp.]